MVAPNPLAARRRTNSSSFSVAVPSSWEESVVSGAIANRFAISRPLLNLKGDQTTIDRTSDISSSELRRAQSLYCAASSLVSAADSSEAAQPAQCASLIAPYALRLLGP